MLAREFDPAAIPPRLPLFIIPGVVLFPHTLLPLHVFEPRYRQMVADALSPGNASDLIVMAQPLPREEGGGIGGEGPEFAPALDLIAPVLGLIGLIFAGEAAGANTALAMDCLRVATPSDVEAKLTAAEKAYAELDVDGFGMALDEAVLQRMDELRDNGFVQASLEKAGLLSGASVAPPGIPHED